MKTIQMLIGGLLLLVGGVWILQGVGVLAGSVMTGQSLWLYIGIGVMLIGVGVIYRARRRP
jgi:LPXTG-motif cell wall-anchored protein